MEKVKLNSLKIINWKMFKVKRKQRNLLKTLKKT